MTSDDCRVVAAMTIAAGPKLKPWRGLEIEVNGFYKVLSQLAMRNPALFSAVASHAGDAYFELCAIPDIPKAARTLREFRIGGVQIG